MKKRLRLWRFAALFALLAVLCTGWILFDDLFDPFGAKAVSVEIPDLRGQSIETAELADWIDIETEYRYDADTPAGTILTQTPAAGSWRKLTAQNPRCTISLTVSLGEESITLPDVVGHDARETVTALREQGFTVETVTKESTYDEGTILSTQPPGGTVLPKGGNVVLTVSAGIPTKTVTVPNLIGLSRSDALVKLWTSQLSVGEVIEADSDEPSGTVIRQSHQAGTLVIAGTKITVYISREYYEE
ncbi:MAG: PASTA domain-containing protein [Clostridia bacterium]|nr:PASTA domain-containing protein [Clostridia bacterium]